MEIIAKRLKNKLHPEIIKSQFCLYSVLDLDSGAIRAYKLTFYHYMSFDSDYITLEELDKKLTQKQC